MYCHYCNGSVKNSYECSCGTIYCCHDCKMKDRFHKNICGHTHIFHRDFEVKHSEHARDYGVFSKVDIKEGQIVFVEKPITNNGKIVSKEKLQRVMNETFPRSIGKYTFEDKMDYCSIKGELFFNLSFVNHCCIPNCGYYYFDEHKILVLIAIKPIKKDEEIRFSYLEGFHIDRKKLLLENFGFVCKCSVCSNPIMDTKIKRIAIVYKIFIESTLYSDILKYGSQIVNLFDEIQASPLYYYEIFYNLHKYSSQSSELPHDKMTEYFEGKMYYYHEKFFSNTIPTELIDLIR